MKDTVSIENISDTNELKFKRFKSELIDQLDVYFSEQRIAIINGTSAPLQWTAKNGSNIPYPIIDQVEKIVVENLIKK